MEGKRPSTECLSSLVPLTVASSSLFNIHTLTQFTVFAYSKTLYYFYLQISCLWTHRNPTVFNKNPRGCEHSHTNMNTKFLTETLSSVSSCLRRHRGGGSGNGSCVGEWFSKATSHTDALRSGPRVLWYHAPPQRHRGLRLCHPHIQE